MSRLARFSGGGMLLSLLLALAALWTYGKDVPPSEAWILDESERIITDLVPGEISTTSFHLRNTARLPRRILGSKTC